MVAKKKTQDVQCYAEVMDTVQTLDAGRRSTYDPDEIEEEQRERDQRNKVIFYHLVDAYANQLYCDSHASPGRNSFVLTAQFCFVQGGSHLCCSNITAQDLVLFLQINKIFQQFVRRVQQDVWERDFG